MPPVLLVSLAEHVDPPQQILGIRFFLGDLEEALTAAASGGLVVAPSAPVLADLPRDPAQREALEKSDLALTDSGLLVLLWLLLKWAVGSPAFRGSVFSKD